MKDTAKTKAQLIKELETLRARVTALEQSEVKHPQTVEALRESEARFRVMFENSHDLLAVADKNGKAIWANPVWQKTLGYTQEAQGHPTEKVHPDDRARVSKAWQAMERGESDITNLEYRYKTASGDYIFLETTVREIMVRGNPLLYVIAHNITERKQAEGAVQQERDFAESLIETAQAIVLLLDTEGRIIRFNPYMEEISGYRLEEVQGKDWFTTFLPEHDQECIHALFLEAIGDVQTRGNVNPIITKDGREREIEWYDKTLKDTEGNVFGLLAIGQDITERIRAEEEIRDQRDRAKMLAEASQVFANAGLEFQILLETVVRLTVELIGEACIITLVSEDGQWLNPVAFHHSNSEARALMHALLVSVPSRVGEGLVGRVAQTGQPLFIPILESKQARALFDSEYCSHLEHLGVHSLLIVPLRVQNRVIGTLCLSRDHLALPYTADDQILSQNLADQAALAIENARLFEAERAAREQLRNLASYLQTAREEERTYIAREIHDEFGQVLTALKMDLSWLSKRLPAEASLPQKVEAMSDLVDSAIQTVRHIATELRPGLLDDLGLVAALEWQAQEFTDRTGLECELHLGEEELILSRDLSTDLFRIFQETLTNVARHAKATKVQVELDNTPDELVLMVCDNGQGITENQISNPKSLGLMGMRERVRFRGGKITFQGIPGRGTTVTVRFPQTNTTEKSHQ
jgi:PAS domain S-box-containing protein